MKTKILHWIRWIAGVFLVLLATLGGYASGDFILGTIVLVLGLWLIPIHPGMIKKWLRGRGTINIPKVKLPLSTRKFIAELDLINDPNLTATIDRKLNDTDQIVDESIITSIGKEIIKQLLRQIIDRPTSNKTPEKLKEVIAYFNFSDEEVRKIREKMQPNAIAKIKALCADAFNPAYAKETIEIQIKTLSDYFRIAESQINNMKTDQSIRLLNEFISHKLLSGRISPKDENDLRNKLTALNLSHKVLAQIIQPETLKQLRRNKRLWQIDNGLMEPQKGLAINLKESEACFLVFKAERIQVARETSFSMNGGGVSVPIGQGSGWGLTVGGGNISPREKIGLKNTKGTVYLTSHRVIFIANATDKSFEVKYENLLSFNSYTDGIEFLVDQNNLNLLLPPEELEEFGLCLNSCLRNFNDPNNEIASQARKALQNNPNVIEI